MSSDHVKVVDAEATSIAGNVPRDVSDDAFLNVDSVIQGIDPASVDKEFVEANWTWERDLFEIFLQREPIATKYKLAAIDPETQQAVWGEIDMLGPEYQGLSPDEKKEIQTAFLESQQQSNVTKMMKFDDDQKGGVDCAASNADQGYWNVRAFYDYSWVNKVFWEDRAWQGKEKLFKKWAPIAFPVLGIFCAIVQLRVHAKEGYYAIQGLIMAYMVYLQLVWLLHLVTNIAGPKGIWTYWYDTSVERTFPGSVRYFSIDYWSMVWAVWVWIIGDTLLGTGGSGRMLWTLLSSASPQLTLALHCTFASPERDDVLGAIYIAGAVGWMLLWFPSQSKWLAGCKEGSTYKGRGGLGKINPNIAFMQKSIMIVAMPLGMEGLSFLFMESGLNIGWWYILGGIPIVYFLIRHIGFAALVLMGIAKFTAHPGRLAFDEYNLCQGSTNWFN